MSKYFMGLLFFSATLLIACDEEKIKEQVDKNGSIEIGVKTEALGDKTLYTYTENIYIANKLYKSSVHTDTLPSLGETIQEFENEEKSWKQAVQKKYLFFVTVK